MSTAEIEFYAIRHAESQKNIDRHLVGGRNTESPLTEKGIRQALLLGSFLLRDGLVPDLVYGSPALRARQTAEHTLWAMGLDVKPHLVEDLHEMSMGVWENELRTELYTPRTLEQIAQLGKDWKTEGGESMNDVGERGLDWLDKQFAAYEPAQEPLRVLGFTHSGTICCMASKLMGWDQQTTFEAKVTNGSMSLFVRRSGRWALQYLDKYSTQP